jgi:hypothetical protein
VRLLASLLVATALIGVLASSASAAVRVRVNTCPTTYAIPGDHPSRATHATLAMTARAAKDVVAWSGGGTPVVLAPHGFDCSALVSADGGVHVRLSPPDASKSGPAIDVQVEGSCVGCISALACGLFPRAVHDTGFKCDTPHPRGERSAALLPNVIAFQDPAGVRGSGVPSGGRLRAVGVVVYIPNKTTFAARMTCTLDVKAEAACAGVISDFLGRVGTNR